jgi:hypothetical protein
MMSTDPVRSDPPLTQSGIANLIAALGQDLAILSTLPTSDLKITTSEELTNLMSQLAAANDQPADPNSWTAHFSPLFAQLIPDLVKLHLAGGVIGQQATGACAYLGGCIQSTKAQCDALGGHFTAGGNC